MLKILGLISVSLLMGGCDQPLFSGDNARDVLVASTEVSPDSTRITTVYTMSGGGAAGWCYQYVGVRRTDQPFEPDSGVLVQTRCSGVDVSVRWRGTSELRISYSRGAETFTRHSSVDDGSVQIAYEEQ